MELKEKPKPQLQNDQIKPEKKKSWFRRKKEVLVGLAFVFGTAAVCISFSGQESSMLYLYKQGKVGIEQLSNDDKMEAWKFTIAQGGECGENFNKVMDELNEEYFRLMKTGNEISMRKLSELREGLIQNQLSRYEESPECKKTKK